MNVASDDDAPRNNKLNYFKYLFIQNTIYFLQNINYIYMKYSHYKPCNKTFVESSLILSTDG